MTERSQWRKSTYSGEEAACVEVALTTELALVRDSKDRDGGTIRLARNTWAALIAGVKQSR